MISTTHDRQRLWLIYRLSIAVGLLLAVSGFSSAVAGEEAKMTVSGKVLKDDAPVPNAEVYIYDYDTDEKQKTAVQADGSFRIEVPKPDRTRWFLVCVAHHPQYSFGWADFSEDSAANLIIKLKERATVSGMVTGKSGKPMKDAQVDIYGVSFPSVDDSDGPYLIGRGAPDSVVKTDSKGIFAFHNLPEGSTMQLSVLGRGYAKEEVSQILTGTEGLVVALKHREGRIKGLVTFGETGKSAEGITVSFQGLFPTRGYGESETDRKGRYVIDNLPAGQYNVFIRRHYPEWTAVAREKISVSEGKTVKKIDLKLVKGGFITGRATDKDTGEPIADHWIYFHDASHPESQAAIRSVFTDEKGFYRFRAAPGRALVYAMAPKGYQYVHQVKTYVDVVEGETVSNVDFQFTKSVMLSGRVFTRDGKPVAGATITDSEDRYHLYSESDGNGNFTITGPLPGEDFSISAHHRDLLLRGRAVVKVQPGAEAQILMERYEITSVSGRVVNEKGEPVPFADVNVAKFGEDRNWERLAAKTDASGKYEIPLLIVGDEYQIRVSAKGYADKSLEPFRPKLNMPPLEDIVLNPAGR